MSPKALLSRLPVDPYIAAIVGMVCLASGLLAYGSGAIIARYATYAAIALLFFLHGARLSPQAALAGASHWRLHIGVLASTFVLFPALGLGAKALFPGLLTPPLWTGVILLCALPSTVGNVAAALCAATASNLLGMGLTPLLVGVLLGAQGGFSARGAGDICRPACSAVDRRLGAAAQDAA
jgi:sodium/bile acid cotransporter 7